MESRKCPTCGILNQGGNQTCDDCGAILSTAPTADWRRRLGLIKWRLRRANRGDLAVVGCLAGMMAVPALYLLAILVYHSIPLIPKTVAEERVAATEGRQGFGFRIQRDRLRAVKFKIEFYRSDAVVLNCTSARPMRNLQSPRWLQGHRGVLIEFEEGCSECISQQSRLFYSFGDGRLYAQHGRSLRCDGGEQIDLNAEGFKTLLASWE